MVRKYEVHRDGMTSNARTGSFSGHVFARCTYYAMGKQECDDKLRMYAQGLGLAPCLFEALDLDAIKSRRHNIHLSCAHSSWQYQRPIPWWIVFFVRKLFLYLLCSAPSVTSITMRPCDERQRGKEAL